MSIPLRIVILGGRPEDADRLLDVLCAAGLDCAGCRVQSEPEYLAALEPAPDLILIHSAACPLTVPAALQRLRERRLDVPLVVLCGDGDANLAAAALQQGAAGYLRKGALSGLGATVADVLERKRQHDARARAAHAAAEAAAERLRAVQTITEAALGYLAVDDSLRELLGRTCLVLAANCAAVLLPAEDGRQLVVRAAHGLPEEALDEVRVSLGVGPLGGVPVGQTPVFLPDLSQASAVPAPLKDHCSSLLAVPLLLEGGLIGLVLVGSGRPRPLGEEELRLLQMVAVRAASVIEHAWLFDQVCAGRKRAQVLSQQLMEAQEAERRHLARELHDEIGQALTAVKINLQAVQRAAGDAALPRLEESVAIVDRALQQVRNLSLDLRPSLLDDLGLVAALRWYLDRQAQRAGFDAEFVADPPGIRAPAGLETACFRVAQEALTNVVRHARAAHVRVQLRLRRAELHLVIKDDGAGFDVPAARRRAADGGSLGLLGMQERVLLIRGRIDIQSAPGQGTTIDVRLPLSSDPALERRRKKRRDS